MFSGREGRSGKKEKKGSRIITTVIPAVLIVILVSVYIILRLYGEKKDAEQTVSEWNADYVYVKEDSSESGLSEYIAAEVRDTIEYEGKTYKRKSYVKAILLLGIDRDDELTEPQVAGSGGQSDALFLAAWDSARDEVKLLIIPRDTMTEIPMTDLNGNFIAWGTNHINLAYAYGEGRERSAEFASGSVTKLLGGLYIDGCLAYGRSAIAVLNDGVGGVTLTVDTDDLEEKYPELKKGATVTLMGEQAKAYVRYRDIGIYQSALDRMERQKGYIVAFVKTAKAKAKEDDSLIPSLMEEVSPYFFTTMYKADYLNLALAMVNTGSFGMEDMITLPGEPNEGLIFDEYLPDEEAIMPIVLDLFYSEDA